jgi:uncharacterized protein (DUF1697 family)
MMHAGLLRAVNVTGHNRIGMADLCRVVSDLGMKDVQSLLQSGNVVFRSAGQPAARLESLLEGAVERHFGFRTDIFVRTARECRTVVAANPFRDEARRDPGRLLVVFLTRAPGAPEAEALWRAITGRETARVKDRQAYIVYPDGVGRSRLTNALIEKSLKTRGTARNWNTVLKLDALLSG